MENFVVQSFSCVQLFVTPWTAACQVSLAFTVSQSLLKLMSIELVMPFNHLFVPFSCPQSFQHQSLFPVSQLFTSGGQSIGVSASTLVLLMNTQHWFPLGLTGLISLQYKGFLRGLSCTTVGIHQFFSTQSSLWFNSHICTWLLEKPYLWLDEHLLAKWSLCFVICCLGLSYLFFQGESFFWVHGCSHHPQWFWSPRK